MAYTSQAFIGSLFFFLIVSLSLQMVAGRNIQTDPKLQPKWVEHDGTVLIPGLGRFMLPKKGSKSLHYNPITGEPEGSGFSIPVVGGSTGGSYIPGGDDTLVPNPGVEVPSPVGGAVPATSSP